jgi:hypothetical protein
MTDRHAAYIVTLEHDIRDDDAQQLIQALSLLRGVVSVEPVPADPIEHIAQSRARSVMRRKLWEALEE